MEKKEESTIFLFVSKQCQYCGELIKEIQKKEPLAKKIQVVDIENTRKLPDGLTNVPALLIDNNKLLMGNDTFDFVSRYGEIEAGPILNSNGFSTDNFSFLNGSGEETTGTASYSFISSSSGNQGINTNQADKAFQQEQQIKSGNHQPSMDQLQKQRDQQLPNQQMQMR